MENTDKNKEKLLALLKDRNSQDSVEISYRKEEETPKPKSAMQKIISSPTPVKSLNLLFWILFIAFDIIIAFVIFVYWL